jgi:hypothetical protein
MLILNLFQSENEAEESFLFSNLKNNFLHGKQVDNSG